MNINELENQLSEWKETGEAPEWMTVEALSILTSGYLLENETPDNMYLRVASRVEELYPQLEGIEEAIYEVLKRGWIGLASPVASNFGTTEKDDRGLPISCFSGKPANSVYGIKAKEMEVALLSKLGGGTAVSYDDIHGSTPVEVWAKGFDVTVQQVSQGASRRGATAHYLKWDHPDVFSFLSAKKLSGDHRIKLDSNAAITLDNDFWCKLFAGDDYCKRLFALILELRLQIGNPYVIFLDNVQNEDPAEYRALGFKTIQSNLCCFSADTKVITQELGAVEIKNLIGKEVTIFDGENWVKNSNWYQTDGKLRSYKITLAGGQEIKATYNHRFFVQENKNQIKDDISKIVQTEDLKIGTWLKQSDDFSIEGSNNLKGAYLKGFLLGDGTQCLQRNKKDRNPILNLHKPKFGCKDKLIQSCLEIPISNYKKGTTILDPSFTEVKTVEDERYWGEACFKSMRGISSRREDLIAYVWDYRKQGLPVGMFTTLKKKCRFDFLAGLFDADACVVNGAIQFCNKNLRLVQDIGSILNSLGYTVSYSKIDKVYRLSMNRADSYDFSCNAGLQRLAGFMAPKQKPGSNWRKIVSVEPIEDMVGYCTEVPSTNAFTLANGILVQNSEIFQHTSAEIGLFCALSSSNVAKYDEWKDVEFRVGNYLLTIPAIGIVLLDAVVEEFLQKVKASAYFEELKPVYEAALNGRAVGLGVMGFHTYLQDNGIPFGSLRARAFNRTLFARLKQETDEATIWLGRVLGCAPWTAKGTNPRRNIQCMALAPTLTNSTITGGISPGIEPVAKNRYIYESAKGSFVRENPALAKVIEAKGLDASKVWRKIQENKGSIQGMPEFTAIEQEVFLTAYEIDQSDIITLASERQPSIDQGQSINLFLHPNIDAKEMYRLHVEAWLKGVKSLYYVRSESPLVSKDIMRGGETNISEKFTIYSRDTCIYCKKTKQLLTDMGLSFVEVDKPWGPVPQILLGATLIGGHDQLVEFLGLESTASTDCPSCEG